MSTEKTFPIVGIGASAGGLTAFEAFLSGMPEDSPTGMAFVLVQHLAPDHKSILSELIRRYTKMDVFEVTNGMKVQPDCAYIIPPNSDMAFMNGSLQLLEPTEARGHRLPIDYFFKSLAQDLHEHAIGIILSGTGSDGTLGIRAIKSEGGMVMVQNPESTEFDGMPVSAIATGLVDYQLPPAEMPARLKAYVSHAYTISNKVRDYATHDAEDALKSIFVLLRTQTGHDFSQYKPNTINRRIERRMAVNQIESIGNYVRYLQKNTDEIEALFQDLLIGVTNFFRDPKAFGQLEQVVIPKLIENHTSGNAIRVWSVGCSTGEEAYSIAILLYEKIIALKLNYKVQVFATDIDPYAIDAARAGIFPSSISEEISAERLARYFTTEDDGGLYRINKSIRDMLVFSRQDVIKDPPFSKIDIISCRNLLIYLSAELQQKLIYLFHYALNPGGVLFLGNSEGIGNQSHLFDVLDRKSKLFLRKNEFHDTQRPAFNRFPSNDVASRNFSYENAKAVHPVKKPLRVITEQALLNLYAPASALVNGSGDIFYLHGRTGQYLEPASGESGVNNILKMARQGLRRELSIVLHKAQKYMEGASASNLKVKTNGDFTLVNIKVTPLLDNVVNDNKSTLYLVSMEQAAVQQQGESDGEVEENVLASDAESMISTLKHELQAKDSYLQSTLEELESSNEELKSSNEEMQSVNEELQSTNEELETSKEELQSVNEELSTVNAEQQAKVSDLSRANNDMNNLLAGTNIATIFVDLEQKILRFTPASKSIINLIRTDIGRSVGHIVTNIEGYDNLHEDIQQVLNTLVPVAQEVRTHAGEWYNMRIQPYRTLNNVIEGAVITFNDITAEVNAKEELRKVNSKSRLAVVVSDSMDAITVQGLDGTILAWNPGAERLYGWSEAEALQMNIFEMLPGSTGDTTITMLHRLSRTRTLEPYNVKRLTKDGTELEVSMISTALLDKNHEMYAIATTERLNEVENNDR